MRDGIRKRYGALFPPPRHKVTGGGVKAREQRGTLAATLFVLLLTSTRSAQAQDAKAIMEKMIGAYQALSSYEGRANVDSSVLYQGKTAHMQAISVLMRYRKPACLYLTITSSNLGTTTLVNNDKDFIAYKASVNKYTRDSAAANLTGINSLMARRAGVIGALDPLYFLSHTRLPDELDSLGSKGSTTVNGHATFVVTGVVHIKPAAATTTSGQKINIPAHTSNWTWWIDKQTYLLQKVEMRAPAEIPIREVENNKPVVRKRQAMEVLTHILTSVKPNAPLADDAFHFVYPPGATPVKDLAELLKNSGK